MAFRRARTPRALAALAERPAPVFAALFALMCAVALLAPGSLVERSDEPVFLDYASRLTHGDYALEGGRAVELLWFGPGFPLLLAPFEALGVPIGVVRLLGPLLLALAVVAFHRLLRGYVGPVPALLGAAAFGLYLPLYRLLPRLYTEPLALLLLVLATLVGARGVRDGDRRALLLSGACLGGLALTRVEYGQVIAVALIITVVAIAVPALRVTARRGAAVLAVALAICVPWLVYTYDVTGKAFYWGNSGGLSLYWMAPQFPEDLGEPHTVDAVFADENLARHRPFFRSIESLDPVAHDAALREEALDRIAGDPAGYARNLAANFSRLWFRAPLSYESAGPKTLFYALPGALLLLALVAAAWQLARRRARLPFELAPFLLVAAGGFGVHVLAAGYPRSIAPLVPLMLLVVVLAFAPRSERADADDVAAPGARLDDEAPVHAQAP